MPDAKKARRCAVAAVLLAAGSSRRFGEKNKLLAPVAGVPLIRLTALALAASRVAEIVAVTGPDAVAIAAALADLRIRFVHNPSFTLGMGGSIATGIRAIGPAMSGALVCPGDMPSLDRALVDRVIDAFEAAGSDRIVYPALADGSQRNPVLWPRRLFGRLAQLSGEGGAKPILAELRAECIPVPESDPGRFVDIDTADDLDAFQGHRPPSHGR